MIRVSVIIPVYNASKTLNRCIDSLLLQGDAIQYIFVNDCSTDDSIKVIERRTEEFESRGCSISILSNQINKGVAYSRNIGLMASQGEYVYWVDADDYLEKNSISMMYDIAKERDLDVVGCDFYLTFNSRERAMSIPKVSSGLEAFQSICYGQMKWNLWLFMTRKSIIDNNDIRFISGANMGEDMMFMSRVFINSNKVFVIPEFLYHYIRNNNDAMTQNYNMDNIKQVDENLLCLIANTPSDIKYLINFLKLNLKLPLLISENKKNYEIWRNRYSDSNAFIMKNNRQSLRTRLLQWFAYKKMYLFVYLYNKLFIKFIYSIIYK